MNSRIRAKLLPFAIASLLVAAPVVAQNVTSSAVTGRILDNAGQPVSGATVTIVHEPSGTTRVVTTGADGRYTAQGLRVGGPFDITATKSGFTQAEQGKVYLQLGNVSAVNLQLTSAAANAQNLGAVTVNATVLNQIFTPDNKGVGTNVSQRELETTPTPGRSIQDIARLDPRVVISDRAEGKITALGQNFRYNNITVDSVSANDPFGLNSNGLATTGTPISQDTIAEYNISVANYDVDNRRGLGANINAVTKSGTNQFHGSTYYVFQNNDMIGDEVDGKKEKYAGFDRTWTAGATLGGPIIKDKLFFFASFEKSKQIGKGTSAYGPEDVSTTNPITGLTSADVQAVRNAAAKYGLTDIGNYTGGNSNLEDKRYLGKLDWNITNNHRASFTWSRTKESQPFPSGGAYNKLVLSSNWHTSVVDNQSYALHFYDDWNDVFSSNATLSYAHYKKDSGPYSGGYMPDITVHTTAYNSPSVEFGTNYSYQANQIDTKSLYASWEGILFLGDHTVKGGFDYSRDKKYNLFLQDYMGAYTFDSLNDFINGDYYSYYYNRPADGLSLNQTAAAFTLKQWGLFLQDTWQVTDRLSVQYGFRVDIPQTSDKPMYNSDFAGAGFTTPTGEVLNTNQYTVSGKRVVQPRMSFNYAFNTERMMQLRGGFGLFITEPPTVWLGNIYTNSGRTVTGFSCGQSKSNAPCNVDLPAFSADPYHQNDGVTGSSQQTVNTVDPNFHLPSAWKFSLGYDAELPWWGLVGTVEFEHLKARDAIWYQDLNLGAPTGVLPDGRVTYYKLPDADPRAKGQSNRANANKAFSSAIINLANTSRGESNNLTLALKKPFQDNWSASVGFTWSRATDVNPGMSSVAMSSYKGVYVTNSNENKPSISNYNTPLRAIASVSWRHAFFGNYYTTIGAFYDGHSGSPYSWAFGNDANGDSFYNDLAYIPRQGGVEFKSGTSQAEIDQFYAYIKNNDYLRKHQGQIAQRNGTKAPWINQIDMSISQEIPGLFKGNKGVVRLDIYNVGNLLNKHWGIEKRASFPGVRALADFYGVDPATGKYIYDIGGSNYTDKNGNYAPQTLPIYDDSYGTGDLIQRWSVQLTVRYKF
ncbi:carboxypeptidase regulatory-like domain-containing protein [Rhodanobacter sp. 115]|uniref:TonB-dependent receptor n=2 Tax=Rhodanobacter sp. FW021-MT20 TaxID=1162282 RepID=UPI0034E59FB5